MCLITSHMTIVRQRVEQHIPRKRRAGQSAVDKALGRFFDNVMAAIVQHVNFEKVSCCIIAR